MTKHIDWNDERLGALMALVVSTGVHLMKGKNGIKEAWETLTSNLFQHPSFLSVSKTHGDSRKVRDKFEAVLAKADEYMKVGNTSKKDGELTPLYSNIQQAVFDLEGLEEEKDHGDSVKRKIAENEEAILRGFGAGSNSRKKPAIGFGARRLIDGSIEGKNMVSPATHFDNILARALMPAEQVESSSMPIEMTMEGVLWSWVEEHGKDLQDLCEEAGIVDEAAITEVSLFGVDTNGVQCFIGIYCAPGHMFSVDPFKQKLCELNISPVNCYKLYRALLKWRKEATAPALHSGYSTPK